MDDQEFLNRIKAKIEGLTSTCILMNLDDDAPNQIKVRFDGPEPEVSLGSNIFTYSGFARMAVEYAVASIRSKRELGILEFHALLARN